MKNTVIAFALLLAAVAPAARAQDGTAYYGVAFGDFEYEEGNVFNGEPISDTASSWRLLVNYQFMEHLAVEGAYGQTDTIRETFNDVPTFPVGTVDLDFSAEFSKILTVRLLGILPFDSGISLMAGLGYSDMKFEFDLTDGVDSISGDVSDNRAGYYFGVQYDWDRAAMRLGYESFDLDGADGAETMLTFFYKL
jgi:hypothetical protein